MYVGVTGASGFIGSHVVAALRGRDHDVRCIVRDPGKAHRALEMHGLADDDSIDVAEADLTNVVAIKAALEGLDAVVHAAAAFSLDPNDAKLMADVNPRSVGTVISIAEELGLSRVVYVSTMGVFFPPDTPSVDAATPLSPGVGHYTESKIAAEKVARAAVADGAPVVSVYPGAVFGPIDPNPSLSDSQAVLRDAVKGKIPAAPTGANLVIIDVRDVAAVCAGAVDGGSQSRYLVPGEVVLMTDIIDHLNEVTGHSLKLRPGPKLMFTIMGKGSDLIARLTRRKLPISDEGMQMLLAGAANPDVTYGWDPAKEDFGVPRHRWQDSLEDALEWMHSTGHVDADDIGALA